MKTPIALLCALALAGCAGQKTKDGELASLAALTQAEEASQDCLEDAKTMFDNSTTMYLSNFPTGMSETATALLLMNYNETRKSAITDIVNVCMRPIAQVSESFNLTDRQRMASQTRIAGIAVGGVVGYLIADSIVSGLAAGNGDEFNVIGPGGRQIKFSDDDQISERGWTVFGGDRTNDTPDGGAAAGVQAGSSPPISNSGDGDVVGNTMNFVLPSGKNSSGSAITDIPNFSPDPVTGGEVNTETGDALIRSNP